MTPLLFLTIALSLQIYIGKDLLNPQWRPAQKLHQSCLAQARKSAFHSSEIQSVICGKALKPSNRRQNFVSAGLIHIFVVSGAHLGFYHRLFQFFLPKTILPWAQWLFLLIYSMTCQFSAPILRASIAQSLRLFNKNLKLNWQEEYGILLAGTLTLLFRPSLSSSLSLPLSWLAALCICQKNSVVKSFTLFIALFPLLLHFYTPHPLSLVSQFLLVGITTTLLLPLHILSFILPEANPLLVLFYGALDPLLETIQEQMPLYQKVMSRPLSPLFSWAYVFVVNIALARFNKKAAKK